MAGAEKALLPALLVTLLATPAMAADFAQAREERFMQACLSDATVAAGQRQALCSCIRDAFAYGGQTSFGLTDVLALDVRDWEAPDRRLPRDALGLEVRRVRHACLRALDAPAPSRVITP